MNSFLFQELVPGNPPSSNKSSKRGQFKQQLEPLLKNLQISPVQDNHPLYGRIFYFNHEKSRARDIHNIVKPLFDSLEEYVYKDDKQIKHFEAIRLDMEHNTRWFEIELDLTDVPDLWRALVETCCFIEISRLPDFLSPAVKVTWL